MRDLYEYVDPNTGKMAGLISKDAIKVIEKNADRLDSAIIYDRDYSIDYFGFKTLDRSYLLKMYGKVVERPQQMLMRSAVGIHGEDIESAVETYNLMSEKWFIHATPTLFNACTPRPQLSSCYLLSMTDDSISGIFETLSRCAKISQSAGGIGLSIHNIRSKGSYIKGTGEHPMESFRCSRCTTIRPDMWIREGEREKGHLQSTLNPGTQILRNSSISKKSRQGRIARKRPFYAMWIPDLFMERVKSNGNWSLFCPDEAAGLFDCYGEEFKAKYEKYEKGKQGEKSC